MSKHKITIKQQRFIDFYDGNATDAARKAGYKHPKQSGAENLSKLYISDAIKNREQQRARGLIATREERQEFWTKVLFGRDQELVVTGYDSGGNAVVVKIPPKMSDRLKASELLGRSEADFTDTQKHVGADGKDLKWSVEVVESKNKDTKR